MDQEDGHYGGSHSIIGAEDEDFENDIEPNVDDQSSYFQSIELVKEHPAYIMVFLHHVVLQFDPSPVRVSSIIQALLPARGDPEKPQCQRGKKTFLGFLQYVPHERSGHACPNAKQCLL